jgi:hypothetical protein
MVWPFAEAAMVWPVPFSVGAQVVIRFPVVMLYARMFARGVWFWPAAEPAGRAWENEPVA